MNDLAPIFRRVAAINPVPDETDLPANVMSATALLDTIDERTGAVQTQQHHTKPQEGPKRRSGWLIAAASFAVAIVFIGAVTLLANTAENLPPVTEPVAESTVAAPIDVAESWFALYEAGDVAGYQALMSADATFSCADCAGGMPVGPYFDYPFRALADEEAGDSRTLYAGHGSLNATCAADGNVVTCDTERESLFGWFDSEGEPRTHQRLTRVLTVEDGVVTEYTIVELQEFEASWFDYGQIAAYGTWLSQNHPKDHAELFFGNTILVNDAEQAARHRMFVADWASAATS
jgi:hypothetical protein